MDLAGTIDQGVEEAGGLDPIPMHFRDHTKGFPKGWYAVAEGEDISADTMKPVSYLGLQLIVYRDIEGKAHVADAYCPHLGAHLASHDGCITGGQIVCPFHKWRFDAATGKCVDIPYTKVVPPQASLTVYPTREVSGIVMMWWHPRGAAPDFEPFDGRLQDMSGWLLAGRKILEGRVPFRDLFENLFDTAHIQQLHNSNGLPDIAKITRTDYGMSVDYAMDDVPEEFPVTSMHGSFCGITMLSQLTEGEGFAMITNSTATPIDNERMLLHARLYIKDTGSEEVNKMLGGAFAERTMMEIDQDFKVLNYKKHLERPLICAGDGPIMKYRDYAEQYFV